MFLLSETSSMLKACFVCSGVWRCGRDSFGFKRISGNCGLKRRSNDDVAIVQKLQEAKFEKNEKYCKGVIVLIKMMFQAIQ